jgi:N-acetylmuramic acid 6-phosphate etherase
MIRLTEQPSGYDNLEKKTVDELIRDINTENKIVALAIEKVLPEIGKLISAIEQQLKNGGRMFYLGCGSGGRLAVLDAIELPNTYGIEKGIINVILAGGVQNLVFALEEKEDDEIEGWDSLREKNISPKDIVIGISASGITPFVLAVLKKCRENGIPCGSIVNNPNSLISQYSDFPIEVITGPEFVTGSTRMKCGTAQKMIFDMISTTVLIRLGRVEGNRMVNARLINNKVVDRSVRMLMERNPQITDYEFAKEVIIKCGNVKKAEQYLKEQGWLLNSKE